MVKKTLYRVAIREALRQALSENDKVLLLGEDIGLFGGAFQATATLYKEDFKNQIIETPISESGCCGLSIGLALVGYKPVFEVMFMDFCTQILDQLLNQAVKFEGMYDGKLTVPLLIRTPAGGYRGYGATHSQSLESIFASVHDLNIIYPYSIQDYYSGLLYTIRNLSSPTLFIENKVLYNKKGVVDTSLVYNPVPNVINRGDSTLVLSYGQAVDIVLEAMEELNQNWTILDLVHLKPVKNWDLIFSLVKQHDRVVFISESPNYASVGEHVVCSIYEECFDCLKQPIKFVSSKDSFIPARKDLESTVLLSKEDIMEVMI